MKNIIGLIMIVIFLVGCMGPFVNIEQVDKKIVKDIVLYQDKSILKDSNVKTLGVVTATSCKHLMWDEPATLSNCQEQLKMKAAGVGANGVVVGASKKSDADFSAADGDTGINRNCWETVDCSGIAIIKFEDKK